MTRLFDDQIVHAPDGAGIGATPAARDTSPADQPLPPSMLFPAAIAFRRSGDRVSAKRTWEMVKSKVGSKGLRLGDRTLTIKQLEGELNKLSAAKPPPLLTEWPMLGGDPSRSARATGSAPFLKARWQTSTIHEELNDPKSKNPDTEAWVKMALSGRWRNRLDWVEGLGLAIGGCWIVLTLLALYSLRR